MSHGRAFKTAIQQSAPADPRVVLTRHRLGQSLDFTITAPALSGGLLSIAAQAKSTGGRQIPFRRLRRNHARALKLRHRGGWCAGVLWHCRPVCRVLWIPLRAWVTVASQKAERGSISWEEARRLRGAFTLRAGYGHGYDLKTFLIRLGADLDGHGDQPGADQSPLIGDDDLYAAALEATR